MSKDSGKQPKSRMIHVRLPEELHKKLRIRAAETDMTIQDWVVNAIKTELEMQSKVKNQDE
ncbi:MAG: toxin-antitoxin system HicB family antitoxin [Dehalococcoides mccartyi]|jgi:HicB family.|uniref:Toxin-antitoxin system HicB family antitoxin n=1 Tax=Dehalococcoides mccartyi TaxID=61435 RepID=A0AB33HQC0_9CHLR|nr:toxin-antitoxin system HicB family antitoxin [Dehalococcoides mccartyi]AQU02707.1 hypothetical protein B1773_01200 [Dehalococcoides mccartyi]AQU04042.1 hypothetical protein B1774_01060 [Dehalococcoides mccartyi]MDP4279502.1 toxin-antitoxin system HicB family antitoxin [Dehalococcoides mccartyi]BAZ96845.1 hypothetical protein DEHALATV1_0217 [Dehalococcoides mccartyi]